MTAKELQEALDQEKKDHLDYCDFFEGFVLDEPVPFNVLFHNIDLNNVTIIIANEFQNWETNKPDIINLTCGDFSWKNNQLITPDDSPYINDDNMLVYASKINGDYDKKEKKVILNACIYVKF